MNTRSRITLSTVLGLTLVGLCLGGAQAQTRTNKTMHNEMKHEMMDEDTNGEVAPEYMTPEPAPINYPFSAPGGVHLYHWTDYTHEALSPDSSYSKHLDNEYRRDRMMRKRLREEEATRDHSMDDSMMEPASLDYPFAAPGGLNLYHYKSYAREDLAEGSAYMKKWDNRDMQAKMMHDRMSREEKMYTWMTEPAPINYPFAAPGGLHLYHYTDYSEEGIAEGSDSMKQMDNEQKRDKAHTARTPRN
jgi:hypothetical protein